MLVFALAALPASLTSCGQGPISRDADHSGAIDLGLQISPGNTVTEGTYTVLGPDGFVSAGNFTVGDNADVQIALSQLPVGTGYELDASASASDGVTTCEGTATFDVVDHSTSTVLVHLVCSVPSGDANVVGTINICPVLDSLGASPNAVALGGTVALTSAAHDTDNGPSPLGYKWTVNGATLRQLQPNLNFVCTSAGNINFTLTASDGDPNPNCADSLTVSVTCSGH